MSKVPTPIQTNEATRQITPVEITIIINSKFLSLKFKHSQQSLS